MPINVEALVSFVEKVGNNSELVRRIEQSALKNNHPTITRPGLYKLLRRLKKSESQCLVPYVDMFYHVAQEMGYEEFEFYIKPEKN